MYWPGSRSRVYTYGTVMGRKEAARTLVLVERWDSLETDSMVLPEPKEKLHLDFCMGQRMSCRTSMDFETRKVRKETDVEANPQYRRCLLGTNPV